MLWILALVWTPSVTMHSSTELPFSTLTLSQTMERVTVAPEAMWTLRPIPNWVASDPAKATEVQRDLSKVEKDLANIPVKERMLLFEKLEAESRSIGDLKNIPAPVNGLLRIISVDSSLEERFLALLESYPTASLGPWAVSQLSGLKTHDAKERFKKLCKQWTVQTENRTLSTLAKQNLK